jgi:hypothetical protein
MSVLANGNHMAEIKTLRVECNNPNLSTHWNLLWEFDVNDWVITQELLDELNILNAPVQLRIVPND